MGDRSKPSRQKRTKKILPTVSHIAEDGTLIELIYDQTRQRTMFIAGRDDVSKEISHYTLPTGIRLIPYSAQNSILRHNIILLPTLSLKCPDTEALIGEITSYIRRYVDLPPDALDIVAHYVLLTWVYDRFNELPYLRVRGDYGCGKTRFLLIVGALCYKSTLASGASTVSPIFHMLNSFAGTLLLDEADFRFSDQTAEIVKILNNGNVRGFPVLRSEQTPSKEFSPRAYSVFGPKIVAMRDSYTDKALESRFITIEMQSKSLRGDIPISLPDTYRAEAIRIRNMLLTYRFRSFHAITTTTLPNMYDLEPRIAQIFQPLVSVAVSDEMRAKLTVLASRYGTDAKALRGMDIEATILEVIYDLLLNNKAITLSMKAIAEQFSVRFSDDYDVSASPRWIGGIIRNKLRLRTQKRNGVYVIAPSETPAIHALFTRYNIPFRDIGDVGDIPNRDQDSIPVDKQ